MSRNLSRVANGTLAIIILAAAGNVAIARAQTQIQSDGGGTPAISTDCGSGTLEKCATEKTFKCEYNIVIAWNPFTYAFEFRLAQNCIESGERPIYKDKQSTTRGTVPNNCIGSREDSDGTDDEECSW
jgi:hypothetical protein